MCSLKWFYIISNAVFNVISHELVSLYVPEVKYFLYNLFFLGVRYMFLPSLIFSPHYTTEFT